MATRRTCDAAWGDMDAALRIRALSARRPARERPGWVLIALNGLLLTVGLVFVFTAQTRSPALHVGEVAPETVLAQHQVRYADRLGTAALRRRAMDAVAPTYRTDTTLAGVRDRQAAAFLAHAAPIIASATDAGSKLRALQKIVPAGVSDQSLQEFGSLTAGDLRVVQTRALTLLSQAATWRFDGNETAITELALLSSLPQRVSLLQRSAIGEVLSTFLTPTTVEDEVATARDRAEAAARVPTVYGVVYNGEAVVRRGDVISAPVMEKLQALGLDSRRLGWQDVAAGALFAAVLILVLFWYLYVFHPTIVVNSRFLLLIDVTVLGTVVGARLLSTGHVLLPFFLPVAAAPTFAAVLVAPEACVAVALATAILSGWVVANSFDLATYYFLSTAAGVLALRQLREIRQFMLAGAAITVIGLTCMLAFSFVDRTNSLSTFQEDLVAAGFNGFVSSTLAMGGFALLSGFFGVTTMLKLFELGQPNQPLLRRLTVRAPGTYNHSLVVSNMVERAAEEIGANSLVAKVGALYHDAGKTANPHCFVENQLGMGNIHDDLEPEESARIIRGHVPQGLKLARQQKLPRLVLDAIAEHHGTMTIAYFLHRARVAAGDGSIDESLFTYPGPKPQSKETALIMLADGCESAVRAAGDHSQARIREIVRHIFRERIEQEQLDECPITLRDLERAQDAFCAVLTGLYHPRIEYPEPADLRTRAVVDDVV